MTESRTYRLRGVVAVLLLTVAVSQTGCVGLDEFTMKSDGPPKEPVCKVVATWIPQVVGTPDVNNDGVPAPCLAGRVYLFDLNLSHTVKCEGTLTVELFNPEKIDPKTHQPMLLERWSFPEDILNQKLLKHDFFDWGYTMGCPWPSYKPDLTHVEFRVRYQPKVGPPLYSDTARVTLAGQAELPAISQIGNVKR